MKIVLDTNVLVSGIFFSGPPSEILRAWSRGKVRLVVTREIFDEYWRVAAELRGGFPDVDVTRLLELILVGAEICAPANCQTVFAQIRMTTNSLRAPWRAVQMSSSVEISIC